jgi:SnoaL-like domain
MKTSSNSELVKAVAHSCQLYDDAYKEALAKLFTEDATLVTDTGILHGREAILKYQSDAFKIIKFSNHKGPADLDSIHLTGTDAKEFFAAGTWSQTVQIEDEKPIDMNGFWSAIILNDGTGRT